MLNPFVLPTTTTLSSKVTAHPTKTNDPQDLLFISYAYEDQQFARWLSRKLALNGYGVWFDQIKILGGESWVEEVDVAIKRNSFRVLAILSKNSITKPNPRKERTLALQVGKRRNIKDFLIPLNLDDTDPDWTLSDLSWRSFDNSWSDGLLQLLKKLKSVDAPRIHYGNPSIAAAALEEGRDILSDTGETLVTNWLLVSKLTEKIRVFDLSSLDRSQIPECRKIWPHWDFGDGKAASIIDPPNELRDTIKNTSESYLWPHYKSIRKIDSLDMVSSLIQRTIHCALLKKGALYSESSRAYYVPKQTEGKNILHFVDVDGKRTYIRVSGKVKVPRISKPAEHITYHPAVRTRVRRMGTSKFVVQLRPCVVLFEESGTPVTGRRVGPRVKRITKQWWNEKWRKRFMAFTCLIKNSLDELQLSDSLQVSLHCLEASVSIIEDNLTKMETTEDEEELSVEVLSEEEEALDHEED